MSKNDFFSDLNNAETNLSDSVMYLNRIMKSEHIDDSVKEDVQKIIEKLNTINVELIEVIEGVDPEKNFHWNCRG